MTHNIDKDILNSNIEYCINEYVRLYEERDILREKWFKGMTIEQIAAEHNKSETMIKQVLYGIGDEILLRASKM